MTKLFKIQSDKITTIKSKDSKGNALVFELKIILKVTNLSDQKKMEQSFSKKITYKNSNDKFKLNQYEKELEKILIQNLVEELINYLSNSQ